MTAIKHNDAVFCRDDYYRCKYVSCPFHTRNVKKYPFFDMSRWPSAKCPRIISIINDASIDKPTRKFFKTAVFERKLLSVPDKIREYFQREMDV